eukprot:6197189-Pleurochrysis_carterae.AAC.1
MRVVVSSPEALGRGQRTCGYRPAHPNLLLPFSLPDIALLAIAGRIVVRVGIIAAAGSAAGR